VVLDEFHAVVARLTPGVALVTVLGELDLHNAGCLEGRIEEAGTVGADAVVVDLSETSFIDSTALSVLVQGAKRLEGRGRALLVVTSDQHTRRMIEVTGLSPRLRPYPTLQDALTQLQPPLAATAG